MVVKNKAHTVLKLHGVLSTQYTEPFIYCAVGGKAYRQPCALIMEPRFALSPCAVHARQLCLVWK